ncbi:MAG: nucleoside hydrolase [Prolixibacteraceae bacterium]|nr:nucleoside hydrolase [Prolixibacteraceae bacterium]
MTRFLIFILVCCVAVFASCSTKELTDDKVNLIFDTDFGPDYDDVGAITVLHSLADREEVNILATIASTNHKNIAASLDVFNTYFGRPDIPVGVPKKYGLPDGDFQNWSDTVTANYPHKIKTNSDAHDALELYRKILAAQPDRSVTIVTVGFLSNLEWLLKSGGDSHSKLTGAELVKKKVKRLVCMAGVFPQGREFNVLKDAAASKFVFENWQGEIIFSGFEIGKEIKTGLPLVQNEMIKNSPVKDVFRISMAKSEEDTNGRMSWDQTAALVAVRGAEPYYSLEKGRIKIVDSKGNNDWDANGEGHFYLKEKMPHKEVENLINNLMMR